MTLYEVSVTAFTHETVEADDEDEAADKALKQANMREGDKSVTEISNLEGDDG